MTDTTNLIERLYDRMVCSPAQNSCRNDSRCEEAAAVIEAQAAEIARLREALGDLCETAVLLKQNCEGCVVNHYSEDFAIHGTPGWLIDSAASIEAARAALKGEN